MLGGTYIRHEDLVHFTFIIYTYVSDGLTKPACACIFFFLLRVSQKSQAASLVVHLLVDSVCPYFDPETSIALDKSCDSCLRNSIKQWRFFLPSYHESISDISLLVLIGEKCTQEGFCHSSRLHAALCWHWHTIFKSHQRHLCQLLLRLQNHVIKMYCWRLSLRINGLSCRV